MISGIIISKNSEGLIKRAINNLNFCDEIIVVDGNSIDNTVKIAKESGAKVLIFKEENFAQQRNLGIKNAKGEWVFYMDTDEEVSDKLRQSIMDVSNYNNSLSAYFIERENYYLGRHKWPKTEKLQRLFRKKDFIEWVGKLHETPKYKGETGLLDGYLLHFTHQDLTKMVNKTIIWSDIEAKLRFDAHHPKMTWWRFFRVMLTGFSKSYFSEKGFLAGTTGVVESMYQGFSMFITYAKLWELQNEK